jgi:hypothetical protein
MDELLPLARLSDHAAVREVATGLSTRSLNWADGGYRRLGGGLADNLALTVTAIAPTLAAEKLALLVRLGLWYYLLDEWFDGDARGRADPRKLGDSVIGIARGRRPAAPGEPLGQELATLLARFRRESRDRASVDAFVEAFVDGVAAAVEHAELTREVVAGTTELPTDEEYLAVASRHIHYRGFALALLSLVGPAPTSAGRACLDRVLESGSRAVRLANDLRTFDKDSQEGSLNILLLRDRAGEPVTTDEVERQLARHVREHDAALAACSDHDLSFPVTMVLRSSLRISVGVYRIADLKQEEPWPAPQIRESEERVQPAPSPSTVPSRGWRAIRSKHSRRSGGRRTATLSGSA